jgi:type IV pilus assembly protein PilE
MNHARGFTLIELMVTVAIIGILTAIAVPSYNSYVLKAHRGAAVTGVLDLASRQARFYTINNVYAANMTALGYPSDPMPLESAQSRYYDLSVESGNAAGFVVKAVPFGKQTKDPCGTFKVNEVGFRSLASGTASVLECWKQ